MHDLIGAECENHAAYNPSPFVLGEIFYQQKHTVGIKNESQEKHYVAAKNRII
jgi:hypothetical protein